MRKQRSNAGQQIADDTAEIAEIDNSNAADGKKNIPIRTFRITFTADSVAV